MSIIIFILVLSAVIIVHEFGHFLFAKLFNVYVYEFSLGMGHKIFKYKPKKSETEYSIGILPLGGYVRLAGEEIEDDKSVPNDRKLKAKTFWQRFLIMFAGAGFNFIFAILLLFIIGITFGGTSSEAKIANIDENYPAYKEGIRNGDTILSINDVKVKTWDDAIWELTLADGEAVLLKVKDTNNNIKEVKINPIKELKDDEETYVYGISRSTEKIKGIGNAFKYTYEKTISLFKTMFKTLGSLFTGKVSVNDLSGPVGIYSVVDDQAKAGFENIIYLIAFLSINVGVINLIPLPAFDGGRILFLIIEKIKGSPINPKIENIIHNVGFILLMALMIYITFHDIIKLF